MNLFTLYATLGLDSSSFETGVNNASRQGKGLANSLTSSIGGASSIVTQKISAGTVALGHLMADAAKEIISLGKQMVTTAINYNATIESYQINFTTLLNGASDAAEALTEDIRDLAAVSPYSMSGLADAAQTLLSFGESSDTVMDTLSALGDIAMGDSQRLSSLSLAFAQASSTGKLMGQDLLQMINAGFNPLQTIANQTGASLAELKEFMSSGKATGTLKTLMREARKEVRSLGDDASESAKLLYQMYEDGAISADTLAKVIEIETSPGGKYYNAMENASKTHSGMIATLEDDASALMGKVFKPLSDFIDEDILPASIDLIAKMSEGYDLNGLSGVVSAATDAIGAKLGEWGGIALDAGASLLADFYTGLTGDETSPEEIKAYIGGVFDDAKTKVTNLVDAGKSLFSGFLEGLNGDAASETNIVTKLGGLFSDFSEAKESFIALGGTILGSFYEKLTGQEATAENIGKTLGGVVVAGITGVSDFLGVAETFMRDLSTAIKSDPQSADETKNFINDIFDAVGTAMGGVVQSSGHFLSDLYYSITSDAEGAEKLRKLLDNTADFVEDSPVAAFSTGLAGIGFVNAALPAIKTVGKAALAGISKATPLLLLEATVYEGARNATNPNVTYTDPETGEETSGRGHVATDADEDEVFGASPSGYDSYLESRMYNALWMMQRNGSPWDSAETMEWARKGMELAEVWEQEQAEIEQARLSGRAGVQQMITELMHAGESNNGISESDADNWLNIISNPTRYPVTSIEYAAMADAVETAYESMMQWQQMQEWRTFDFASAELREAAPLADSATRLEQAAQVLIEAGAALAAALLGVEVNLDGEKVGELVTARVQQAVVREMRTQFPTLVWGR